MTKQKWTIPDKYRITLIIFTITLIITSCRTGTTDETGAPKTVSYVDLKKYAGTWYEIARYPNSSEKLRGQYGNVYTNRRWNDERHE